MNVFHRASNGRFFYAATLRIICIPIAFVGSYVKSCFSRLAAQCRGGLAYWRGGVGGGVGQQGLAGVNAEQCGGANDCVIRKSPALVSLLIRLPAYSERLYQGGALGKRRGIRQFVVDVFGPGQSILSMTTKAGR